MLDPSCVSADEFDRFKWSEIGETPVLGSIEEEECTGVWPVVTTIGSLSLSVSVDEVSLSVKITDRGLKINYIIQST